MRRVVDGFVDPRWLFIKIKLMTVGGCLFSRLVDVHLDGHDAGCWMDRWMDLMLVGEC